MELFLPKIANFTLKNFPMVLPISFCLYKTEEMFTFVVGTIQNKMFSTIPCYYKEHLAHLQKDPLIKELFTPS
jgi:hypothetical protein